MILTVLKIGLPIRIPIRFSGWPDDETLYVGDPDFYAEIDIIVDALYEVSNEPNSNLMTEKRNPMLANTVAAIGEAADNERFARAYFDWAGPGFGLAEGTTGD